ncbi:MAG TPA: transcription elongation factor GreA [Anaerolineaceae bacterium]
MSEPQYLTPDGLQRLKAELEYLSGPARDALAKRLRAAIQQGDLSENADYIVAKEEQGFLEGRIQELQAILQNVVLIEEKDEPREIVDIGARVTIQEDGFDPDQYHLVGPKEADPRKGRISYESPIGKAILGHRVGDVVTAETPGGTIELKIVSID